MTIQGMTPAVALSIPSPNWSGWSIGHVTIHMYAICILAGIIVAYVLGTKRYEARGGSSEEFDRIATWGIIFGIVGARAYHVITDHQLYFGPGRQWYRALYILSLIHI